MIPLECVTVCRGYADFLAETAPLNRPYFNRWVIVTAPDDEATLDLCHQLNLTCLMTDDLKRNGSFNKGRGIQRGFQNLACDGWVLHLDADIALPSEFPHALDMTHLDPASIYGCDRMLVKSSDEWHKIRASGYRQHGRHCYVLPHEKYPIGTRWASPRDGYCPIGFFQLVHGSALIRHGIFVRPYPDFHSDAARADVKFAMQWDRSKRVLIPELLVWHLESEPSPNGINWNGRKSKPFAAPTSY